MKIAVLDIGGTSIKAGLFDKGIILRTQEYDTNAKLGGEYVMKNVISILRSFPEAERIGISTAGQVDSKQGIIKYANSNIPGYTGMKIRELLQQEFKVPVALENDVNAAAIGEANFGAGKEFKEFICLTYGTGVGGAMVLNGEIYRGHSFSAGEMGGIIVHPEERNTQIDKYSGCYEKYASTTALVQKAIRFNPFLDNGKKIFENIEIIEVKKIVDQWIVEIVIGLTSLIHVLNPQGVVLGGGVMRQEYVIEGIKKNIAVSLIESFSDVKIVKAALGNQAGMFGAAVAALEKPIG